MYNPKIVDQLIDLIDRYRIPVELLNLEITESAYMSNPDLMKETICKLRAHGFIILMDDFGSGYSSLNTLKDIDVDILKIDMKFLPTGESNSKCEKILVSVARMAGWIGIPVIVEGVETKEQRDFIESIGCTYIQGYYYSRPVTVGDYEVLIEQSRVKHSDVKKLREQDVMVDFDDIWSSDSKTGVFLRSMSLPFAIFESDHSNVELLRVNDMYKKEFGNWPLEHYLIPEEMNKLIDACAELEHSGDKSDCECLIIMKNGEARWYYIRLTMIGVIGRTSLVSATFSDVTSERMLEKELNSVFNIMNDDHKKNSLLIIDDQEIGRESLKSLFENEYNILLAEDGVQGIEQLTEHAGSITAILLDMIMPNMGGKEFLMHKNKIVAAADIPVIVISSENDADTQINMLKNGVNDYVTKPFVPAVVKKRLKNVLEYNSRFRDLVHEYQKVNAMNYEEIISTDASEYSITEVQRMIVFMSEIFNLVRLVDPVNTSIVNIKNDELERIPYSCFSIWGRAVRCENCSSICAHQGRCVKSKFELLKDDVFYIISKPIDIRQENGQVISLVLEVATRISEQIETADFDKSAIYSLFERTRDMIYIDPLTGAYNRRFLDESLFLYKGQNKMARELTFVMMDMFRFKQINDTLGHQTGDKVLIEVVKVLTGQVRDNDSIIRYGGDEFLIVLTNCDRTNIQSSIERFRDAVRTVTFGPNNMMHADGDFGYAYTDHVSKDGGLFRDMIKDADEMMYSNKKKHREEIKRI